ncbi:MAG TPA: DUF6335 family protein [Nitrospiraceae bacterium]|nr:DUF6335 family protein [Nitrospiraceae bacterium]
MSPKRHEQVEDANETIRRYYEDGTPLESEGGRDGTEPVSPAGERTGKPARSDRQTTDLSGGDDDASGQGLDAGTEAAGGSNPLPDQDVVDEIGRAAGVTYQDSEPLKFGDKAAARDSARWELNPASSEDYQERRTDQQDGTEAISEPRSSAPRKKPSTGTKRARSKRPAS